MGCCNSKNSETVGQISRNGSRKNAKKIQKDSFVDSSSSHASSASSSSPNHSPQRARKEAERLQRTTTNNSPPLNATQTTTTATKTNQQNDSTANNNDNTKRKLPHAAAKKVIINASGDRESFSSSKTSSRSSSSSSTFSRSNSSSGKKFQQTDINGTKRKMDKGERLLRDILFNLNDYRHCGGDIEVLRSDGTLGELKRENKNGSPASEEGVTTEKTNATFEMRPIFYELGSGGESAPEQGAEAEGEAEVETRNSARRRNALDDWFVAYCKATSAREDLFKARIIDRAPAEVTAIIESGGPRGDEGDNTENRNLSEEQKMHLWKRYGFANIPREGLESLDATFYSLSKNTDTLSASSLGNLRRKIPKLLPPGDKEEHFIFVMAMLNIAGREEEFQRMSPTRVRQNFSIAEWSLDIASWRVGWLALDVYSWHQAKVTIYKLNAIFDQLPRSSPLLHMCVRFAYFFSKKDPIDGALKKDVAIRLWTCLLKSKWPLLSDWNHFISEVETDRNRITQDQWDQLPLFASQFTSRRKIGELYDPETSYWPTLYDIFARYIHKEDGYKYCPASRKGEGCAENEKEVAVPEVNLKNNQKGKMIKNTYPRVNASSLRSDGENNGSVNFEFEGSDDEDGGSSSLPHTPNEIVSASPPSPLHPRRAASSQGEDDDNPFNGGLGRVNSSGGGDVGHRGRGRGEERTGDHEEEGEEDEEGRVVRGVGFGHNFERGQTSEEASLDGEEADNGERVFVELP